MSQMLLQIGFVYKTDEKYQQGVFQEYREIICTVLEFSKDLEETF